MSMVYGLFKRRIKYTVDDKDSKEGKKIVYHSDGLEMQSSKRTSHQQNTLQQMQGKNGLLGIVGRRSYKTGDLMADLEDKNILKHYREKLCLVWFVHFILLARDVRKVIEDDFLALVDVMDYTDEVSHPRIIRWLAAKNNPKIKEADLFNPPDDAMGCASLDHASEQELGMASFITLGVVDTITDPTIELIKKELARSIAIRRAVRQDQPNVEALYDQPTATDPCVFSRGIAGGVVDAGDSHPDAAATVSYDYEEDKLLKKLEAIIEVAEELKSKRGVIPPNKGPLKKVHIYVALGYEEKKEIQEILTDKTQVPQEYLMHSFDAKDFTSMANMHKWYVDNYVDEILCLMRGRQLAYPNAYDVADRIIDLNFYNNLKSQYDTLCSQTGPSGRKIDQLVSTFECDEDMIDYVRGKKPYPHGKNWTKAKRIHAVMNVKVKHFLIVEILLDEGKIKIYDCNLPFFKDAKFLTHVQLLLKLFPKLLMQSKLIDHLPAKVLIKES
ncbi:hypothetical protein P3S68_011216 [Capsicum galapagoense]